MFKYKLDSRVELLSFIGSDGNKYIYPRHGFPLEVFIIYENAASHFYTTSSNEVSCFTFKLNSEINLSPVLKFFYNAGHFSLYDIFSWEDLITNNIITAQSYFSLYKNFKINCLKLNINKYFFKSDSNIFSNSTWLERENSEMFNLKYSGLRDNRKLLLDYTTKKGVLLSSYKYSNSNFLNKNLYFKNYYGIFFF